MPFTKDELIKMINLDEPDYPEIVSKLTQDDIPILVELTTANNPAIATKAISCLGLMKSAKALQGLESAAKHPDPVRRIAAANSLRNMTTVQGSTQVLEKLLDDTDIGVRKFALKTVEAGNVSALREKVRAISLKEANPTLKSLSENVLQRLR
jgi:HEAT repeat protein